MIGSASQWEESPGYTEIKEAIQDRKSVPEVVNEENH